MTRSQPKAVHLTSVHPASDIRIRLKECATLAAAGWQVVLVAPHEGPDAPDEVRLHRVPRAGNRLTRFLHTTLQVYRAARAERGDVYHFHDPELLGVGLALHWGGAQVVYDVHEDAPATIAYKHYIPSRLRPTVARLLSRLEQAAARRISAVVSATPAIHSRFTGSARRAELVQNFPRLREATVPVPTPYRERQPWAVYLGVLSRSRGLFEMVDAMGRLPTALGARLQIAGLFSPFEIRDEVSRLPGWPTVDVHGVVGRADVARLLDAARVGLVLLHPERNYLEAYATKMFEYMAAGIPVVASDFPLWRQIVSEAGCGLLVDPLDPAKIAEAVKHLFDHPAEAEAMGERGWRAVRERFNWELEAPKLVRLYDQLRSKDSSLHAATEPDRASSLTFGTHALKHTASCNAV